jgi:hypothetical protein
MMGNGLLPGLLPGLNDIGTHLPTFMAACDWGFE